MHSPCPFKIFSYILVLLTVAIGQPSDIIAQSRKPFYSREIAAVVDNDILFFQDYYYTAGQDLTYRRLIQSSSKAYRLLKTKADSAKIIVEYRIVFKIFTPTNLQTTDVTQMDRAYAGWTAGSITFSNFPTNHSGNQYQLEVGAVGPMSGMESFHKWLHTITHYEQPKGWEHQIPNEWVINAYYARLQNWKLARDIDLISQSAIQLGTGSNKLSQEITLRLMQFNSIDNSAYANSRLNWDTRKEGKERPFEFFFFCGMGIDYVMSNIFIQGSLFKSQKSPVDATLEPWLFRNKYGLMYSNHSVSWSITFYHLSNEILSGTSHSYASLALGIRF